MLINKSLAGMTCVGTHTNKKEKHFFSGGAVVNPGNVLSSQYIRKLEQTSSMLCIIVNLKKL